MVYKEKTEPLDRGWERAPTLPSVSYNRKGTRSREVSNRAGALFPE